MMTHIHPTAVMDGDIQLEDNVAIGPYVVIKGPAVIGSGTILDSHVCVEGPIVIGKQNHFFPFSSLGTIPQDLKYRGEKSEVLIGVRNIFREFVTVNRGTEGGDRTTRIGSDCLLMAYAHVAHDCVLKNHVILANAATLAGHVQISDHVTVGAFTGIHQFCRIGIYAFIGGYSVILKDTLPFIKTVGDRGNTAIYGINYIGLKRLGFSDERITTLKRAYRLLFRSSSNLKKGLEELRKNMPIENDVKVLVDFIETSDRGVIH